MKVYRQNASVIKEALNFWKAENLISAKQCDELNGSLKVIGFNWERFTIFIIPFAILFFIIASIDFIEGLTKYFENNKIMVSFIVAALDILFYVLGTYSKVKWPDKFYSNNGLLFLGILFTPCTILIFFAALNGNEIKPDIIGSYFLNVTLISCILYIVVGILLKSKLIWCFALIALGQWISFLGKNDYWLEMSLNVRLMLYGILLITLSMLIKRNARISFLHRTTLVTGLLHLFISLWFISISGNYPLIYDYDILDKSNKPNNLELLAYVLIFTAASFRAIYYGIRDNDSVICNIGVIFFIINLYTRYFEYFWNNTHYSVFFTILGISLWALAIKAEKILNISLNYNVNQAAKESL